MKKNFNELGIVLITRTGTPVSFQSLVNPNSFYVPKSAKPQILNIFLTNDASYVGCQDKGMYLISLENLSMLTKPFREILDHKKDASMSYTNKVFDKVLYMSLEYSVSFNIDASEFQRYFSKLRKDLEELLVSNYDLSDRLKNKINKFLNELN